MNVILVMLHVLGATVWTGGHLILALGFLPAALKARDPEVIRGFETRFEPIGIGALVLQVITGVLLTMPYLPAPGSGEPVNMHVMGSVGLKVVLLLATVGLAVHARLRLLPRLSPETLGKLAAHIIAVTVIAVLFVVIGVAIQLAPAPGG